VTATISASLAAPGQPADPGLFGPDSVTWRVHGDPVLWVGGLRALFLQALHPRAMAGLAAASELRSDPWGRLLRTAGYVGTVTYGTTAAAEEAGRAVRRVHETVPGMSPDLLVWVHCCLVDSFLTTHLRAGGRLTAEEADTYVAEQARLAPLVGLAPADVPADTRALAAYFDAIRPELRRTPEAVDAARLVLLPPLPPRVLLLTPARPAWAGIAGLAFALLPRWARRLYALPGLPVTDPAASVAVRVLGAGLRRLPERWQQGPHLRAARARLGLVD